LAGGLNSYGFADGDPINFSDPFGLCKEWLSDKDDGKGSCDYDNSGTESASEIAASKVAHASNGAERLLWNVVGVFNTMLEGKKTGTLALFVLSDGVGGSIDDIVSSTEALGAQVTPHPTNTGQGVAIDFGDGTTVDVRVETHGGLHGNVQRWENGREVSNTHVRP
jgi:hypothetical protein